MPRLKSSLRKRAASLHPLPCSNKDEQAQAEAAAATAHTLEFRGLARMGGVPLLDPIKCE